MRKVIVSVVAAALLGSTGLMAETSANVTSKAVKSAKAKAESGKLKVIEEAVSAVVLTQNVIDALDKNDVEKAKSELEKAIGKLEIVLAHKDAPALLPIDSVITATEYMGDLKSIKETLSAVKKLLATKKVQEARRLLDTLQSEIDIVTVSLPLISYPQALRLSARYLNEGKIKEAGDVLKMALDTLVRSETIIPLPLLKAQALIEAAQKVAKSDKQQALKHLDAAKKELKIAEALGYTSGSDTTYKMLDDAIEAVEKEIRGKNRAEKLFEELMEKLKEFKEKALKTVESKKSS